MREGRSALSWIDKPVGVYFIQEHFKCYSKHNNE